MPWTGIAAAGVSALASGASAMTAGKMNHKNFKRQQSLMKMQQAMNRSNYKWQMDNYLSPAAMRRLYENAGYNINEVSRVGGSMVASGQLGQVSNPGVPGSVTPDFSGLRESGSHVAQSVVRAREAKLKEQQAMTEQKLQFLHSKQADLYEANKDNVVVKTALDNVNLSIAKATQGTRVKMTEKEYETMCDNLVLIGTHIAQNNWQLNTMNPLIELNKQAEYVGMLATATLATARTSFTTAQTDFVIEATRTEVTKQLLNKYAATNQLNQAKESILRGKDYSWAAQVKEQTIANLKQDVKESEARTAHTWRNYHWTPIMNSAQLVETGLDVVSTVLFKGLGKGVLGSSMKQRTALEKSLESLNRSLEKAHSKRGTSREYFDKNGELMGGYVDTITW